MEQYIPAEIEVIRFDVEDVITTSVDSPFFPEEDIPEFPTKGDDTTRT